MERLCSDNFLLDKAIQDLTNFLKKQIPSEDQDKQFLAHFVRPSMNTFGIQLDKPKLQYCKEIGKSKVWLIGDSCNTYPTGHSIELGLLDVFILFKMIFEDTEVEKDCISLEKLRYKNTFLSCDNGDLIWNFCENMKKFNFSGGYPRISKTNDGLQNKSRNFYVYVIDELEKYMVCKSPEDIIDKYNKYQFQNYFNNVFNIVCADKTLNDYETVCPTQMEYLL